jgi:DNA-binding transcriptional MerR regulator
MSSETFYNITKAAQLCGVTNPTIRKAYKEGKFPNATEGKQGKRKTVSIPLGDLQTSGYLDKVNSSQGFKPSQTQTADIFTSEDRDELITLREREKQLREQVRQLEEQLDNFKQREAQLFRVLETREQQERRRKFWSFGNSK